MKAMTPRQMAGHDEATFVLMRHLWALESDLESVRERLHVLAGDERQASGWGRPRAWKMTPREVLAEVTRRAGADDAIVARVRQRPSDALYALKVIEDGIAGTREQIEEREALWAASGRWARYFPCLNADGHIHASLRGCPTVRWDTAMGWATEYSGRTVEEAIHGVEGQYEGLGETLCSVCFPQAPAGWCRSRREVTREQREQERLARAQAREDARLARERRVADRAAAAATKKAAHGTSPQERRLAGIRGVTGKWLPVIETADREALAAEIEALAALGRSANWQDVIAAWAEKTRDEETPLRWSVVQYSVHASSCA